MSATQDTKQPDDFSRSTQWSGGITLAVGLGNLVVVLALARLLDPADFGGPAIGIAALGFVLLFVQNGLPGALIFQQEQLRERLSGLFWSNIALGVLGSLLLLLLRHPLAVFFKDIRLVEVLTVFAVLPVVSAAGAIYKSIQLRDLAYRHTAGAELLGFLAGAGTGLYMAVTGYGYWSLVGQITAKYAAEYLWYIAAGWIAFRPTFIWKPQELRPHFRFAIAQSGERLTMYLNANWDTLLIGRLLGTEVLGVYDVFKRLIARPTSIAGEWIDRFAFAVMARTEGKKPQLAGLYLSNLRLLSLLLAPFALFGVAFAEPVLAQLTGPAWEAQVSIFRLMLLAFSINALLHPLDGLLSAVGKIQRLGYANVLWAAATVPALIIGSAGGLQGVASALFALALMAQYPLFRFLIQPELGISAAAYFKVPAQAVLLSGVALLPAWATFAGTSLFWPAAAIWSAGGIYAAVLFVLFRKPPSLRDY